MDDALLSLARDGDVAAFDALARPGLERLRRLARIATGDAMAADAAVVAALVRTRRDIRAIGQGEDVGLALERSLGACVRGRPRAVWLPRGDGPRLTQVLDHVAPPDRVALARCLDAAPDAAGLAIAARLGVDVPAVHPGDAPAILELDGALTDWDLVRLRAALAARDAAIVAAGADRDGVAAPAETLLEAALARGRRPAPAWLARLRRHGPPARAVAGSAISVALVIVVATVALGTQSGIHGSGPEGAEAQAGRSPDAGGGPGAASPGSQAAGAVPGRSADFPTQVDGFYVRTVDAAIAVGRSPGSVGAAVAVRGWLTPPALVGNCALSVAPSHAGPVTAAARSAAGPDASATPAPAPVSDPLAQQAAFCERAAVLLSSTSLEVGAAHLHVQILPGTAVTGLRDVLAAAAAPQPAIVLGHFGDPRAFQCDQGGHDCGLGFVVDRVLWASGLALPEPVAIASPAIPRRLDSSQAARIAIQSVTTPATVVSVAGVGQGAITATEPAAVGTMAGHAYGWLVRIALQDGSRFVFDDPTVLPTMTWVLVDDVSGAVVRGSGPG